ncbi:hypothetical protein DSW25_08260 [Sulfitobacter donghicola DSW-25 = KCTC 12864 = JCM 14565]|uniref:Flagellar motor switch protein FliN-like C-terminal domain-containing protein n=2 Tax=Sulfitobacter TaxID=60136 RepID=A0A073IY71_9RHOB|nr:hypothetical protein DSW25_08260 [Sulfitobacter donghicola DSW-25 = KCTC 12864 = JCM 14565]
MTSLVHRKARTGREIQAARSMSLARALRVTAAKQADRQMGLAASAIGVTRETVGAEDISDCLKDDWLVLLMDGEGGQVGAVLFDPSCVTGLIQQQTMGKVIKAAEEEEARRHTATDAALCAPLAEALLRNAAGLPDDQEDCELLAGYRFGVWAQEVRQATMALEAPSFEVVEMVLDLAAGARTGKVTLILPEPLRAPIPQIDEVEAVDDEIPEVGQTLVDNTMALHADLTVALARLSYSIQQVSGFKVGDVLDLNISTMTQALVIDANGRAICRGTLGQVDGVRAVQVQHQKGMRDAEPRRRASDREDLDLPDVTAPQPSQQPPPVQEDRRAPPEVESLPAASDIDIFGDIKDLPEMPDMEEAAQAADDLVRDWGAEGAENEVS